jgi:molybdopterin-guanine dinucleotide biosynthesis protein
VVGSSNSGKTAFLDAIIEKTDINLNKLDPGYSGIIKEDGLDEQINTLGRILAV